MADTAAAVARRPSASMAVAVWLAVTVTTTAVSGAFLLPEPQLPQVVNVVNASCLDQAGHAHPCTPDMDEDSCTAANVCVLSCPTRTAFPDSQVPLTNWTWSQTPSVDGCRVLDPNTTQGVPTAGDTTNGLLEVSGATAACTASSDTAGTTGGRLSLSLWLLPNCSDLCMLGQIGSNIALSVKNNSLCINTFCGNDTFTAWTYVVLQVNGGLASLAVNGEVTSPGLQDVAVTPLSDTVKVTVGFTADSTLSTGDGYQLYDARYYNDVLTFRELQQLWTSANLTDAGQLSECRCPPTHPTLAPSDPYTCLDHTGAGVKRVVTQFRGPFSVVDSLPDTQWAIAGTAAVILTVELYSRFQVELVEVGFQGRLPGNAIVSLPVGESNSLFCSGSSCSYSLGLNSLSVSPDLFAGHVVQSFTITFVDAKDDVDNYVVSHLWATGRCNCNGNADSCNRTTLTSYTCDCDPSTNTRGDHCEYCTSNRFHNAAQFDCQGSCDCLEEGVVDTAQMCNMDNGTCQCKINVEGNRCDACRFWTFNLTASDPKGCQHCSCHVNGSVGCDNNTGDCSCKTNVRRPLCSECVDGFYDTGLWEGPDRCDPCQCSSAGSLSRLCNKTSGQCSCKGNVQGVKCDQCRDGFYNLQVSQSQGCLPCDCNPIGSVSQNCHKATGQCPCENGLLTSKSCNPQITAVSPRFGPLQGGTVVTISGQLLGNSSQVPTVYLGNVSQTVIEHDSGVIVVRTGSHSETGVLQWTVSWLDDSQPLDAGTFTFRPDPQLDLTSLPVVNMFTSGGCGIVFKGSDFASVASPRVVVSDAASTWSAFDVSEARVVLFSRPGVVGDSDNLDSCRHVQQDLLCSSPNLMNISNLGTSSLRFGLHLDGIVHDDLGPVTVKADPRLDNLGSYDLQYPFETTLKVTGSGLTGGCERKEVKVFLGVVTCDLVALSSSEIECEPPRSLSGKDGVPITVKIGGNLVREVGRLNYLQFWETSYFKGIIGGVCGFIVLVGAIVLFCCCRRRCQRQTSSKRQSQMDLVPRLTKGSYPVQNQYSDLPGHGLAGGGGGGGGGQVNNGFHGTIQAETVIREPKNAPPPTAKEMELLSDFLQRIESSLWEGVKAAVVSSSDLSLGRVCTHSGQKARIIEGKFATFRAGQKNEKQVLIKTLKDPLPGVGAEGNMLPTWINAGLRECLRLHRHSNDHVLSILGLALTTDSFHVIYPFMKNRTLKDHIVDSKKEFSVRQLMEFGLQVADGLVYLHTKDLVHRDVAARNCMVDANSMVKISDATFSWDFYKNEYVYDKTRERYMPLRWMAPESLMNGYYDVRTDVWSLGVLLWELLTRGCLPFHEVGDEQVKSYLIEGYMLGKPDNCSDHLYEVMKECWSPENEHRPHMSTVVQLLGEELTGSGVEQDDIYVNLGSVEGYYENQATLAKGRRKAPLPPSEA